MERLVFVEDDPAELRVYTAGAVFKGNRSRIETNQLGGAKVARARAAHAAKGD
jgi:hypothetical protein